MKMKFTGATHITLLVTFLAIFGLTGLSSALGDEPLSPYQESQIAADEVYAAGDYKKAYKKYLSLARKGDTFSQYRLSYMNFQGQGVNVDWDEAFAWAVLAAQGNNTQLVRYMAALAKEVPEEHHTDATNKAKHYLDRWGDLAIAEDARRGALQELRQCTGSRLGIRCEEVYSMKMPKFWAGGLGISPSEGRGQGSISNTTGNGAGGPVLNTRYYQALRWGVRDIENYLVKNAGNIEIGELEMIDV